MGEEKSGNRPVSPVLSERYDSGSAVFGGFDRGDVPRQKLVDAIGWVLGDALQNEAQVGLPI